jgi:hypothetical protein
VALKPFAWHAAMSAQMSAPETGYGQGLDGFIVDFAEAAARRLVHPAHAKAGGRIAASEGVAGVLVHDTGSG